MSDDKCMSCGQPVELLAATDDARPGGEAAPCPVCDEWQCDCPTPAPSDLRTRLEAWEKTHAPHCSCPWHPDRKKIVHRPTCLHAIATEAVDVLDGMREFKRARIEEKVNEATAAARAEVAEWYLDCPGEEPVKLVCPEANP